MGGGEKAGGLVARAIVAGIITVLLTHRSRPEDVKAASAGPPGTADPITSRVATRRTVYRTTPRRPQAWSTVLHWFCR